MAHFIGALRHRNLGMIGLAALAASIAGQAQAQPASSAGGAPMHTVSLSASASTEVPMDTMRVTFNVNREAASANAVSTQIKQALDAALAEARKVAKPKAVDVSTGNVSIYPRYSNKGGINGWQGSAELTVEGTDKQTIAELAGRISSMAIGNVGYSLSREAREKAEGEVTADAVARFRAQADRLSKLFGYSSYVIREVNVSADANGGHQPMYGMRAAAMEMKSDAPLPVEAGNGTVTVTVSGSVQMAK